MVSSATASGGQLPPKISYSSHDTLSPCDWWKHMVACGIASQPDITDDWRCFCLSVARWSICSHCLSGCDPYESCRCVLTTPTTIGGRRSGRRRSSFVSGGEQYLSSLEPHACRMSLVRHQMPAFAPIVRLPVLNISGGVTYYSHR